MGDHAVRRDKPDPARAVPRHNSGHTITLATSWRAGTGHTQLVCAGGTAHPAVLPGAGGYHLHAHRLSLPLPEGGCLELEAPLPAVLAYATEPMTDVDSLRKAASQSFASVPG